MGEKIGFAARRAALCVAAAGMAWVWIPVLLSQATQTPSSHNQGASANSNELGKVLILEYHLIEPVETRWGRSVTNFKLDLENMYASGYRPLGMDEYIDGRITLPQGSHPVIFTFDDSSPGQFRYLIRNGKKVIDPECAVGMMIEFNRRHPDFRLKGIFFVLPGAKEPNKLFGQTEYENEKLRELVALGFEIGNHTLWHANLSKYGAPTVRKQLALAVKAIQQAVPLYQVRALSLPFGAFPADLELVRSGSYEGVHYSNQAILLVSGGPAPSPFSIRRDLLRLPRIQVTGGALSTLLDYYKKHPGGIFASDGDAGTITFPKSFQPEFNAAKYPALRVVAY